MIHKSDESSRSERKYNGEQADEREELTMLWPRQHDVLWFEKVVSRLHAPKGFYKYEAEHYGTRCCQVCYVATPSKDSRH